MATDIYSMLTGGYDPRAEQMKQQQLFQQQLSQSTTPQAFLATVGSNMGNMLGQGVSNALGGPSKQQKVRRIMQAVGSISDPLGQAQEAYKLFQQEGMAKRPKRFYRASKSYRRSVMFKSVHQIKNAHKLNLGTK
jgi:hypothetical protein